MHGDLELHFSGLSGPPPSSPSPQGLAITPLQNYISLEPLRYLCNDCPPSRYLVAFPRSCQGRPSPREPSVASLTLCLCCPQYGAKAHEWALQV